MVEWAQKNPVGVGETYGVRREETVRNGKACDPCGGLIRGITLLDKEAVPLELSHRAITQQPALAAPAPTPLTPEQVKGLRGVRPAGPPPRPSAEPVRVQRRASNTGVIMVVGQKIALGQTHKHQTVTVLVSDTTLAVESADGEVRVIRRTTTQPVRSIKGQRPRTATSVS